MTDTIKEMLQEMVKTLESPGVEGAMLVTEQEGGNSINIAMCPETVACAFARVLVDNPEVMESLGELLGSLTPSDNDQIQ